MISYVGILVNEMSVSVKVPPSLRSELTHNEYFGVTQDSDCANTAAMPSWRDNRQRMEHKRYLLDAISHPKKIAYFA